MEYDKIRIQARKIASLFPEPDFYKVFSMEDEISRNIFNTNPVVNELRLIVVSEIENDFGHGMDHVTKVSIDAGTLICIESDKAGHSDDVKKRLIILSQCAGLLHDIKRKHKDHAVKSAGFARKVLKDYDFFKENDIMEISLAIENHEAFKTIVKSNAPEGKLISDCLYDADKFRWGPDNFTHTVWDMLAFSKTPIHVFLKGYKNGIEGLAKIKQTFRSKTGKKYGPQFIDIGLDIGRELYKVIGAS
jgi:hypothetical protein